MKENAARQRLRAVAVSMGPLMQPTKRLCIKLALDGKEATGLQACSPFAQKHSGDGTNITKTIEIPMLINMNRRKTPERDCPVASVVTVSRNKHFQIIKN